MNDNILKKEERQYYTDSFSKRQGQNYPCSNQNVVCAIISSKSYEEITEIMLKKIVFYINVIKIRPCGNQI